MTLSICPFVRTSDQTCSCTKMPSYCTRQARATLDTVSPVESESRWTWKLRLATHLLTPQHAGEKCRISPGESGTAPQLSSNAGIRDPTRHSGPTGHPVRI